MNEINKREKVKYFDEIQYFSNSPLIWILYIVFFFSILPLGYAVYSQLIKGKPWGTQPMSNDGLLITFLFILALMVGVLFVFLRSRLITFIDNEGLHYRFPPLVSRDHIIDKSEIKDFKIRTYRPILEYGGWGVRINAQKWGRGKKYGIAYNVKGNIGLQLYLTDGKKILIGTQKPDAIIRGMKKYMQENKEKNE